MTERAHARLSPSAAHRWINCPASVRVVETLESKGEGDSGSIYAAEGTAAHTVAELMAGHRYGLITDQMLDAGLAAWKRDVAGAAWLGESAVDSVLSEMIEHAVFYTEVIGEELARQKNPQLHLELKVSPGVAEVWGTGDTVITGRDEIAIVDYKYGTGVRVDAPGNEQLMLYGLGAYESDLIGTATIIRIIVVQPRLEHVSVWELPVEDLLKWRAEVAVPAAELALSDNAHFGPSEEACRFCPARGQCKAQMEWAVARDFGQDADLMDGDDFADALTMMPAVKAWLTAVEEKALQRVYSEGKTIPGWKAVLSGGQRKIVDQTAAIDKLVTAGYKRELVTKPPKVEIQTLGELDRVVKVGRKKVLAEILGDLLTKTDGRPSLVPEDDARPAVTATSSAADDFADDFADGEEGME